MGATNFSAASLGVLHFARLVLPCGMVYVSKVSITGLWIAMLLAGWLLVDSMSMDALSSPA